MILNQFRLLSLVCALALFNFAFAQIQTYELSEQSTASFTIEEVLLGQDKTVIGTSIDVQGNFSVNPSDLSTLEMSMVTVGTQAFETDNRRRNGAIQNRILDTETFPSIVFEFGSISSLISVEDGSVTATITGSLTIKDVTREQVFNLTLNSVNQESISGSASSTILYQDYGLNIPPVPMVASVEDEVLLQIDFVAVLVPVVESQFVGFPVLVLGEQLYQSTCVACHGANGEGYANEAMPAPAVNGSEHAWHHPDEQILGLIANGGPNMPAIGAAWTQEEREAVWIYVKHWWPEDIRRMHPGELGETLLAEFEQSQQ